jgi:hypothetical protein
MPLFIVKISRLSIKSQRLAARLSHANVYVRGNGAKTVDLETKLESASPRTIARARSNRAFAGGEFDDEYWYDLTTFEIEKLQCFSRHSKRK